jgi:DNA-binding MarR family transcriptional regulator
MLILLALDEGKPVSQYSLAGDIGVGPTMAHHYVTRLIHQGLVSVQGENNRCMQYTLTEAGQRRVEQLGSEYAREMARLYRIAKVECRTRLLRLYGQGLRRVVLFGAAESGELAWSASQETPMTVLGVVDNDPLKHRAVIGGLLVESPEAIEGWHPDGVIIAASRCGDEIYRQIECLKDKGIAVSKL